MMPHPDYEFLQYEQHEQLGVLTLNRPEAMNALHLPAHAELIDAWRTIEADDEVWVLVLTGAGDRAFCAGTDLKWRVQETTPAALATAERDAFAAQAACTKPIIAAVNGYAVGGGLELALGCDLIVASPQAKLGLPEARRSLLADAGGTLKLPRRIPYHLAMGMVLTGRFVEAAEARAMGLINDIAADGESAVDAARRWADEILACGPLAVRAAKQVVRTSLEPEESMPPQQMEALPAVQRLRQSEDYAEGPRAFAEKRTPEWKGR